MKLLILTLLVLLFGCQVESPLDVQGKLVNENLFSYTTTNVVLYRDSTSVSIGPIINDPFGYNYTVTPTLPSGLALDSNTGVIYGQPNSSASIGTASYTIQAVNPKRVRVSQITIEVKDIPIQTFNYTINNLSFPLDFSSASFISSTVTSPVTSGGVPTSFSISPPLPNGLTFNSTNGTLSGYANTCAAQTQYTVSAINSGGTLTTALNLAVTNPTPYQITYNTAPAVLNVVTYTVGDVASLIATHTNFPNTNITWSMSLLNSTSSNGLFIIPTTGEITGILQTETQGSLQFLVSAEHNQTKCKATQIIYVTAKKPNTITYNLDEFSLYRNYTFIDGFPIKPITPVYSPTDLAGKLSVAISPGIGLNIDSGTGIVSGVATFLSGSSATINNTGSPIASIVNATIFYDVVSDLEYPSALWQVGTPVELIPNTEDVLVATYALAGTLPVGINFNSVTGVISGTPALPGSHSFNITATAQTTLATSTVNFTFDVDDLPVENITYSNPNPNYICNQVIEQNIPTTTGGVNSLSYSLLYPVSMPAGLSLNTSTGIISGTPTTPGFTNIYGIQVTNSSASIATVALPITIKPEVPVFTYGNIHLTAGSVPTSILPVTTHCAFGESYSISPNLPTGVTLTPQTGQVTANTAKVISKNSFNITATNSTGASTKSLLLQVDYKAETDFEIVSTGFFNFDNDEYGDFYILEKYCTLLCTAARLKIYKGAVDKTYTLLYDLNLVDIASAPTYFDITTIAISDFNSDGKKDFLFFEKFSQKVFVLENKQNTLTGPHFLQTAHVISAPTSVNKIIVANLRARSQDEAYEYYQLNRPLEIIMSNNSSSLYIYRYSPSTLQYVGYQKFLNPIAGALTNDIPLNHMNQDSTPEEVDDEEEEDEEVVFNTLGVGTISDMFIIPITSESEAHNTEYGDERDSNYHDLVILDKLNSRVCVILGNKGNLIIDDDSGEVVSGTSDFNDSCETAFKTSSVPQDIVFEDINGDYLKDVVILTVNGTVEIFANNGNFFNTLNQANPEKLYSNAILTTHTNNKIFSTDMNNNVVNDLIVFNATDMKFMIYYSTGNETVFSLPLEVPIGSAHRAFMGFHYKDPFFQQASFLTCDDNLFTCGISYHPELQISP